MSRFLKKYITGILLFTCSIIHAQDVMPIISETMVPGYFPLVQGGQSAVLIVDDNDFPPAKTTTKMLSEDIFRVTNIQAKILATGGRQNDYVVVIGTVGKSKLIDELISRKKIDISSISNKWESFVITTVDNPFKNVKKALVIAGSDRRGTAFGVTSLSESIGISPWYFWADVNPKKKKELFIQPGIFKQGEPSVQYRGIFLNDERFGGLAKWAEQTYDKDTHQMGPKTYEKIFELLLRLKANYLWPAMHPGTKAFNLNPENAKLADDYGIVMGSSHCEQMLRNNEGEWKDVGTYGDFNYGTNRETMVKYWEDRVRANGKYENTYTLGLRGIHDYAMEGAKTLSEQVQYTQTALNDQRELLRRYVNPDLTKVPQVLCVYKEVLAIYQNGLNLPDDVTLLWADDNHGYLRSLSNPQEQKRAGGAGVYYHLSYHGDPDSWFWLSPIAPSLTAYEMTKAYEYGANKIWVFNIGDIKPAEKELSFAMELAWNIKKWTPKNANDFIGYWASKTFGKDVAEDITSIMAEYYKLAASGKEHHVRWVDYSYQEMAERIQRYLVIREKAENLSHRIPDYLKEAYFELILYPVKGASLMNEYLLYARMSLHDAAEQNGNSAMENVGFSRKAYDELNKHTDLYNLGVGNGKWNHFFNWRMYGKLNSTAYDLEIATTEMIEEAKEMPVSQMIEVTAYSDSKGVFFKEGALNASENDNTVSFKFESNVAGAVPVWIQSTTPITNKSFAAKDNIFCTLNVNGITVPAAASPFGNIWHALDIGPLWNKIQSFNIKKGTNIITISGLDKRAQIHSIFVGLMPPLKEKPLNVIDAKDFVAKKNSMDSSVEIIPGLGYGNAISVLPFKTESFSESQINDAPWVEYAVNLSSGSYAIDFHLLPTQQVYQGRGIRYAVSVDDSKPEIFSIRADEFTSEWQKNVLRGYAMNTIKITADRDGAYKVRVYFLDPGIVLQDILIRK